MDDFWDSAAGRALLMPASDQMLHPNRYRGHVHEQLLIEMDRQIAATTAIRDRYLWETASRRRGRQALMNDQRQRVRGSPDPAVRYSSLHGVNEQNSPVDTQHPASRGSKRDRTVDNRSRNITRSLSTNEVDQPGDLSPSRKGRIRNTANLTDADITIPESPPSILDPATRTPDIFMQRVGRNAQATPEFSPHQRNRSPVRLTTSL